MTTRPVEVLLVEDNPQDVGLTEHAFRRTQFSHRWHVVGDGAEALDYLFCQGLYAHRERTHPKVVLLDLKLPKVDGREVLRRVRADERTHAIAIVALTSSREERDIAECYSLGVNSYIVKPVDFEQFVSTVRELGLYRLAINQLPF